MIREFIDREEERSLLEREWQSSGGRLIILYGRRRIGKTRIHRFWQFFVIEVFYRGGKIALGGCVIEIGNPYWHCKNCGHRWWGQELAFTFCWQISHSRVCSDLVISNQWTGFVLCAWQHHFNLLDSIILQTGQYCQGMECDDCTLPLFFYQINWQILYSHNISYEISSVLY